MCYINLLNGTQLNERNYPVQGSIGPSAAGPSGPCGGRGRRGGRRACERNECGNDGRGLNSCVVARGTAVGAECLTHNTAATVQTVAHERKVLTKAFVDITGASLNKQYRL